MTVRSKARQKAIAYHEAGHAVVGRVLTLVCGPATIKPDHNSAAHSICADPYACEYEWERQGRVRGDRAVWHARIITFMAGAEAEAVLLGRTPQGDGHDQREIWLMLEAAYNFDADEDWERVEARLRALTRVLVRRHRARIERVAEALLTKSRLSAKQLDRLVGRSVADVRVNAPFLLMMAQRQATR